jgi:hypothetical protein
MKLSQSFMIRLGGDFGGLNVSTPRRRDCVVSRSICFCIVSGLGKYDRRQQNRRQQEGEFSCVCHERILVTAYEQQLRLCDSFRSDTTMGTGKSLGRRTQ